MTFQDPNTTSQVTGYNVYRSNDPSLPISSWSLVRSDKLDQDLWLPDQQLIDGTGDTPLTGVVVYYTGAAYNDNCPSEGPF